MAVVVAAASEKQANPFEIESNCNNSHFVAKYYTFSDSFQVGKQKKIDW